MNLADLLDDYQLRKRCCKQTMGVHRTALRQLAECLGHTPTIDDLSDDMLLQFERFLDNGTRAPFTVRERVSRLRSLWRFASDRGLIATRPTISPPPAVPLERPKAYTYEEMQRLVKACGAMPGQVAGIRSDLYWRSWVIACYVTGERAGALFKLIWSDVHLDADPPRLEVPAITRKCHVEIPPYELPSWSVPHLEAIRQPQRQLVWPWPHSRATFYHHFTYLLERANLPTGKRCQSQKIRRTHLTLWAANGGNATKRAEHSDSRITERYYLDQTQLPRDKPDDRLPRIG